MAIEHGASAVPFDRDFERFGVRCTCRRESRRGRLRDPSRAGLARRRPDLLNLWRARHR
ncbi:MAG TPA: hypothetical protein VIM49_09375 [Dermatophilaceae bacterium]